MCFLQCANITANIIKISGKECTFLTDIALMVSSSAEMNSTEINSTTYLHSYLVIITTVHVGFFLAVTIIRPCMKPFVKLWS